MAFRGRGGSRGGGGTQGRGGRGRGGALGRGASKVPAFPVVSAAPIRRASFDDDDGDAPPTAVSARAGREDDVDYSKMRTSAPPRRGGAGNYHQKQQHQQQPQRPQRQHEGMPSNKARVQPPKAAPAAVADGAPSAPRKVITTVTSEGTELPKRLNNKIFIDGLPYNYEAAGKPSLEDEIMQFATAWKVGKPLRLIKRPGQGFGFLVFQSPHSVATAIRVLNGRKFLGRSLRVEEPKPRDLEAVQDIAGMKDLGKDSFSRQVLLTDLAKVAQPEIIREVLREVAPQLEAKLDTIKMTSNNRKAFLTFTSDEDVQPALRFFDGFQLLGRKVSAVPAAAPGSLPYSRGGAGRATPAAPLPGASGSSTAEGVEDFDEMVVPLGAEVPQKEARAPRKLATPLQQTSSSAANVSGITSKYNLLDQGPCEVYVGNLADDITAEQLRQHFAACGKLKSCELLVHPQTRLATGIARLTFVLPAYAAYAQEKLHGSRLRGCVLRVDRGDDASAPLTEELPAPTNEDDDYDEEAYLRRYGVTDKAAYFKGTSLEEEMGAATTPGKKRSSAEAVGTKKGAKAAEPATKRAKKEKLPAVEDDEGDDDDDMGFVVSGMVGPGGKGGDDDDDDDDEEHFYDVDEGAVEPAKPKKGGKKGTSAKSSGGKPGKKARKA